MAITGCLAAPVFNVLGGFGASLLVETAALGWGTPFQSQVAIDPLLGNALAFQAAACLLLLVGGACSGFVLGRGVGLGLVLLYCSFLVFCFLIGLGRIG